MRFGTSQLFQEWVEGAGTLDYICRERRGYHSSLPLVYYLIYLGSQMAVQFQEEDAQHSLRVGDMVLLYAKETNGFVFSELSRYSS